MSISVTTNQVARSFLSFICITLLCVSGVFAQDDEALKAEIEAVADQWVAAYNQADAAALAELYTEDVMLMPPHTVAVTGREGVAAYYQEVTEQGLTANVTVNEVHGTDEIAHAVGEVEVMTPEGQMVDHGNWMGIFRQVDGTWKIHRLTWSSELPMQAAGTEMLSMAIRDVNEQFMEAVRQGDMDMLAGLYTEDAALLPPNAEAVQGRMPIRDFWQSALTEMGVAEVQLETAEVAGLGDTAYEQGEYTILGETGDVLDQGKYMVVWKQRDGEWRLYRDIWNTSMPPAPGG